MSRIQERIKSRFSGGLVVDIQKPDYELRKKIVSLKINELNKFLLKSKIAWDSFDLAIRIFLKWFARPVKNSFSL